MAVVERASLRMARSAPGRSARNILVVLLALTVVAIGLRLAESTGIAQIQNFLLVSTSLLIEALPFILLGAVVSAAIEVFVPGRFFARVGRLPASLQMPLAGLGGFAFPVCECGSVPVARRLASKGLSPGAALTFMLAAPVLNPIVLIATAVAYRGREAMWIMVGGRAALALVVALVAGWVLGARSRGELLRAVDEDEHADCAEVDCAHHEDESTWKAFSAHLAGDFLMLGKYLVIGAAAAGLLQTFVPQSLIEAVADAPVLSILALMGLAAALSLCSQSDAFVAASFVQFGAASQLAFLVFGPMVDAKLGFLYAGTFSRGFVRTLVVVVAAVTLAGTLWLEVAVG
jgi:uncharacterized membrane protein YraQ (UPF0718 family)